MPKKFLVLLIGLFLLIGTVLADGTIKLKQMPLENASEEPYEEPVAYISYIEGSGARILSQESFEEAEVNMLIFQGDELRSQHSRLEIYLTNRGYLRLDYNTIIDFKVLNEKSVIFFIWRGNVYVRLNEEFAIQTLNREEILSAGSYLIEVGKKTKIYSPKVPFNDFVGWNFNRNDELNYRARQRYLSQELAEYEYVLLRYGAWRYYSPYGYVWIPRVAYGWRPYLYGRWVWYPVIGWTWISYEPFGWCVYHYGRWQWHPVWGWYWIPTRYWGPAWVYWYWGYDYVGWYPSWYDQYNYYRYRDPSDRGWTWIHKNQLQQKEISKSVISKQELRQKLPRKINKNQLKKEIDPEKTFGKKESRKLKVRTIKKKVPRRLSKKRTVKKIKKISKEQKKRRIRKREETRPEQEKQIRKRRVGKKETKIKSRKKETRKKQPSKKSKQRPRKKAKKKVKKKKK